MSLSGFASLNYPVKAVQSGPVCSLSEDETTLFLRGSTDDAMLACVEPYRSASIESVNVDSHGGNVLTAIAIGEILAGYDATLIVTGNCSSSCSNYFIPVAQKLIVSSDAIMLSHGGIDDGFVEAAALRGDIIEGDEAYLRLRKTAAKQSEYAERYNIPLGWLLSRKADAYRAAMEGAYLTGEPYLWGQVRRHRLKYLWLEPEFIQSCFPDLELIWPERGRLDRAKDSLASQRRHAKAGIYPTGSMRCAALIPKAERRAP